MKSNDGLGDVGMVKILRSGWREVERSSRELKERQLKYKHHLRPPLYFLEADFAISGSRRSSR